MSIELTYLTAASLLAASLWIPFIVGVNMQKGDGAANFIRPPALTDLPPWVHRAHRAHLNLLEQLLPFGLLVLVATELGISSPVTVWAAAVFFWLRVAHAVGMISGLARMPARPLIFTAAWVCILAIGVEVIRLA